MNLTSTFKKALFVKFVAFKNSKANFILYVEISYFVPSNKVFSSFLKNKVAMSRWVQRYNQLLSIQKQQSLTKTAFKKDPQAQTLSELQLK